MIFKFTKKILINILLYIALFAYLETNKTSLSKLGIIGQKLNLSSYTQDKSKDLIEQLENQNLAINFLSNQRTLSETETISFQSSGLIHLLAVSGAQIIPVCKLMGLILLQFFYFSCRNFFSTSNLMNFLFYLKNAILIATSFLMTGLFSCAGALVRVTFLSAINEFLKSQKALYAISELMPIFSNALVRRSVLLFFMSLLFGNIFLDYSFLLSSIGAAILEIISLFLYFFLKKIQMKKNIKNFVQPLLLSILTSFTVSILLFPISRVSFLLSSFSNILAAPVVTFIVTPLSLLLLFIPKTTFFYSYLLNLFDDSLSILNFIAETFSDPNYALEIPKILLFSYEGKLYLIVLLIILFSIIDVMRSRDEEFLRFHFSSKN